MLTGHVYYRLAVPMAVCNVAGSFVGTRLAILRGNRFVRWFFLAVVTAIIGRLAYDILSPLLKAYYQGNSSPAYVR